MTEVDNKHLIFASCWFFLSLHNYIFILLHISLCCYIYLYVVTYIFILLHVSLYFYIYLYIVTCIFIFLHISLYCYIYLYIVTYIFILLHIALYFYIMNVGTNRNITNLEQDLKMNGKLIEGIRSFRCLGALMTFNKNQFMK